MSGFLPTINFGGLASGLDTNTIVAQLMAIERQPQVRLRQKQLVEEARRDALNEVATKLSTLSLKIAGLRDVGTWGDVQTVDSSAATVLTATRTAGAAPGAYAVAITDLARAHQVKQGAGGATSASATGTLVIAVAGGPGVTVNVAAGDDLTAIAGKVNSTSGIGVYASVVSGVLYLSGKTTGATQTIGVTGTLATEFKLGSADAVTTISAQNASLTVNGGAPVSSATNDVTDAIAGVTITLKAAGNATVTVGAPGPDEDAVVKKAQEFVDEYNAFVDYVRGKLTEKKVRDPKTDFDRRKGALAGDAGLSQLLSSLRQAVGSAFAGRPADVSTLAQVGVSTGATTGSAGLSQDAIAGKLTLDSGKLGDMLRTRFEDVKTLFTNVTGAFDTEGVSQRLDRYVNPWSQSGGVLDARVDSEESTIESLSDRIAELDERLALREKQLRAQFTAMEKALEANQQHGAWLSGQLRALSPAR